LRKNPSPFSNGTWGKTVIKIITLHCEHGSVISGESFAQLLPGIKMCVYKRKEIMREEEPIQETVHY